MCHTSVCVGVLAHHCKRTTGPSAQQIQAINKHDKHYFWKGMVGLRWTSVLLICADSTLVHHRFQWKSARDVDVPLCTAFIYILLRLVNKRIISVSSCASIIRRYCLHAGSEPCRSKHLAVALIKPFHILMFVIVGWCSRWKWFMDHSNCVQGQECCN